MVDWRGCSEASKAGTGFSSVLTFLREAAVAVVLSLGSLGLRGFFSFGLPSSPSLPSTSTSFFLRGLFCLTGGVEVFGADAFVFRGAFVRLEGCAELAGEATATPPA